jgi:Pyridoxamine 5'-phosphate oxidase
MGTERFELQAWESASLIRSQHVGRACIVDHGCPIAFPVSYQLVGADDALQVVVRTAPQTLLGRYEGPASLEVDMIDEVAREAWSVIVRGNLRHVTGAHGLPDPGPWMDNRHHWMVLTASSLSGRRFAGVPSADGYSVDWEMRPV